MPDWKVKLFKEEIAKKEETITVFSRYQDWITVTPKKEDRRKPLEKKRILKNDVTSKLMPKWMDIQNKEKESKVDNFKLVEYNYPLRQKPKKIMIYVDKDINPKRLKPINFNPNKSIFNFGDFRHDVRTQDEANYYGSQVSQMPKKFFDWDDEKKFNPKFKKDI